MAKLSEQVAEVPDILTELIDKIAKGLPPEHEAPVDIQLEFNSLMMGESGVPLITKKKRSATTTIKLATRITR